MHEGLKRRVSVVTDAPVRRMAVKKVGIRAGKVKTFDPQQVQKCGRKIKQLFRKDKCKDIFEDAAVVTKLGNELRLYEAKDIQKKMYFRFKESAKQDLYLKLKLLLSMKAINGELFLQVILRCIQLQKEIFLLEVEEGREVYIPQELSQDHLPHSFRYYDPILKLIQDCCSRNQKESFRTGFDINVKRIQDDDWMVWLNRVFGGWDEKPAFKHSKVNDKTESDNKLLNPLKSKHSMSLQRSKYVMVENSVNELKHQFALHPQSDWSSSDMYLRFCLPQEVNNKRQKYLVFKG